MSLTDDKYDRQVRIWGGHGQQKLVNAHICLIGCSPAGVEALKNLVLPGVGRITIVDNQIVSEIDAQNNFFTPYDRIGEKRAKVVLELLLELNPDVQGTWTEEYTYNGYDLVIVNDEIVPDIDCNVVVLQTCGLIARLRLYSPVCEIIESKPMGEKWDLRVSTPFPELEAYFQTGSSWLAILYNALSVYKSRNQGKGPKSFYEKESLKQILLELHLKVELNVLEAIENKNAAIQDDEWKSALELEPKGLILTSLIQALKIFYNKNNQPPLGRKFPDMECPSGEYLQLKNEIYGRKAQRDFEEFKSYLDLNIPDEQIQIFIENIHNCKIITYRSLSQEEDMPLRIEGPETQNYLWYIALRACNNFKYRHNRHPGPQDLNEMIQIAQQESVRLGVEALDDKIIHEICRYQGSHLNMVATVLGGIAAQEATKLIVGQFVPINNTLIYNGLTGEMEIYEF